MNVSYFHLLGRVHLRSTPEVRGGEWVVLEAVAQVSSLLMAIMRLWFNILYCLVVIDACIYDNRDKLDHALSYDVTYPDDGSPTVKNIVVGYCVMFYSFTRKMHYSETVSIDF